MLTSIAGPTLSRSAGQEVDMDEATAGRLIASGQAEVVREGPEAATALKTEAASVPRAARREPAVRRT